ncbi:hypothetical protein [Microcella sp.]|uniref:hypothetical protein n=1 Tax=Microcella sp. TaxID=1913979 RepID=UPI00256E8AC4|nr:hypothetical protein [Microcella sp.]MBX9472968.1 hypothetical protein [Microcella sp.]
MHRRTPLAVATVLGAVGLVVAGLSGCAVQQATPVTDAEAHDRFLAALDDTQDIVGGDWDVLDDPTPRECVIPLWVAGERYPALRVGDAPVLASVAADRVESAWNDQGMRVTRTDIGDVIEVKGESAEGELLVLRVSESASTLLGESECRPR